MLLMQDMTESNWLLGRFLTLGEDFLFPYYRDMLTVLSAGMTAEEIYPEWYIESD